MAIIGMLVQGEGQKKIKMEQDIATRYNDAYRNLIRLNIMNSRVCTG